MLAGVIVERQIGFTPGAQIQVLLSGSTTKPTARRPQAVRGPGGQPANNVDYGSQHRLTGFPAATKIPPPSVRTD